MTSNVECDLLDIADQSCSRMPKSRLIVKPFLEKGLISGTYPNLYYKDENRRAFAIILPDKRKERSLQVLEKFVHLLIDYVAEAEGKPREKIMEKGYPYLKQRFLAALYSSIYLIYLDPGENELRLRFANDQEIIQNRILKKKGGNWRAGKMQQFAPPLSHPEVTTSEAEVEEPSPKPSEATSGYYTDEEMEIDHVQSTCASLNVSRDPCDVFVFEQSSSVNFPFSDLPQYVLGCGNCVLEKHSCEQGNLKECMLNFDGNRNNREGFPQYYLAGTNNFENLHLAENNILKERGGNWRAGKLQQSAPPLSHPEVTTSEAEVEELSPKPPEATSEYYTDEEMQIDSTQYPCALLDSSRDPFLIPPFPSEDKIIESGIAPEQSSSVNFSFSDRPQYVLDCDNCVVDNVQENDSCELGNLKEYMLNFDGNKEDFSEYFPTGANNFENWYLTDIKASFMPDSENLTNLMEFHETSADLKTFWSYTEQFRVDSTLFLVFRKQVIDEENQGIQEGQFIFPNDFNPNMYQLKREFEEDEKYYKCYSPLKH